MCWRQDPARGPSRLVEGYDGPATLKLLAHAAAVICLYLAFSFVLFLGLQVNPVYGNIGLAAVAVLFALYVYLGFVRKLPLPAASADGGMR